MLGLPLPDGDVCVEEWFELERWITLSRGTEEESSYSNDVHRYVPDPSCSTSSLLCPQHSSTELDMQS